MAYGCRRPFTEVAAECSAEVYIFGGECSDLVPPPLEAGKLARALPAPLLVTESSAPPLFEPHLACAQALAQAQLLAHLQSSYLSCLPPTGHAVK